MVFFPIYFRRFFCKQEQQMSIKPNFCHRLPLVLNEKFNRNQLKYVKPLVGQQSPLTSLIMTDYLLDASVQIDLIRQLKENQSIIELELGFQRIDKSSGEQN